MYDKALLVVDMQNDFCPGGALGVPDGDKIIPTVNTYIELFEQANLPIFFSRDWHPDSTSHFEDRGGDWPHHCVRNTPGAEFHPHLYIPEEAVIVSKGTDPQTDGYSVFEGMGPEEKTFETYLRENNIQTLYIAGLATDFCVRFTSKDAVEKGYQLNVLTDATKGVDPDASKQTLDEISRQGGRLLTLEQVETELQNA